MMVDISHLDCADQSASDTSSIPDTNNNADTTTPTTIHLSGNDHGTHYKTDDDLLFALMDPFNVFQQKLNLQLDTLSELNATTHKTVMNMMELNKAMGTLPDPHVYATMKDPTWHERFKKRRLESSIRLNIQTKEQVEKLKAFRDEMTRLIEKASDLQDVWDLQVQAFQRGEQMPSNTLASAPSPVVVVDSTATVIEASVPDTPQTMATVEVTDMSPSSVVHRSSTSENRERDQVKSSSEESVHTETEHGVKEQKEGLQISRRLIMKSATINFGQKSLPPNHSVMLLERFLEAKDREDMPFYRVPRDKKSVLLKKTRALKNPLLRMYISEPRWNLTEEERARWQLLNDEEDRLMGILLKFFLPITSTGRNSPAAPSSMTLLQRRLFDQRTRMQILESMEKMIDELKRKVDFYCALEVVWTD
ncbi:hypothetical protein BGZ83_007860 [Gryganskiella cystojenkinii]|nr:hypothetical protein BGZ83_007860 [Gryganskiella cystojenkinii]